MSIFVRVNGMRFVCDPKVALNQQVPAYILELSCGHMVKTHTSTSVERGERIVCPRCSESPAETIAA